MTERDSDIDFDFFEDLEPRRESSPPERTGILRPGGRPPGGGGEGGPPRAPTQQGGPNPMWRMAALVGAGILLIVLLVVGIKSCSGTSKKSTYSHYLDKVGIVAKDSEQIGKSLTVALTTPGLKPADLASKLDGLAQQQQQDVATAQTLKPPAPLRAEQASLVEAFQFRVSGLKGLADAFRQTAATKDVAGAGILLSEKALRLTTSDVIYEDLYRSPVQAELVRQGISGVPVPGSTFNTNTDFPSPRYWVPIVQRTTGTGGGGSGGSLHGTGLVSVAALPGNKTLDPNASVNTVLAGTNLAFAVTVQDTGDAQEVGVKVTLTIQQQPTPIVKTETIALINPGDKKTLTFSHFDNLAFATPVTVKVDVAPVPFEKNTSNNSAQYKTIFTLK